MESEVRIKATCSEMYKAFQENEVFLIKYYELADKTIQDTVDRDNDVVIFNARIRHRELAKKLQNRVYTIKGLEKTIQNMPTEKPRIQLVKVLNYSIPSFGNRRSLPYATLLIRDSEGAERKVDTKEAYGHSYIKVDGFSYTVKNKGTLYNPILEIEE